MGELCYSPEHNLLHIKSDPGGALYQICLLSKNFVDLYCAICLYLFHPLLHNIIIKPPIIWTERLKIKFTYFECTSKCFLNVIIETLIKLLGKSGIYYNLNYTLSSTEVSNCTNMCIHDYYFLQWCYSTAFNSHSVAMDVWQMTLNLVQVWN